MAVINRPLKDLNMASILRKIADGKLPVDGLRYRLPNGQYVKVAQVIHLGNGAYKIIPVM